MQEENLRSKATKSLIWKLFERFGAQIISFVVSLILARLLSPDDYGALSLLLIFTQVANVFVQSGFPTALIRKKPVDDLDYSSVFYFSLAISVVLYVILFFAAPYIAEFYETPILKNVLRVLALTIVIGTYNSMQNVKLQRELMFKKLFISSFASVIVSGIIGIIMAYLGFGVWALVGQQLSNVIIVSVVMTFTVKWRPKLMFSFSRIKKLFMFGWKLLFSGLLDVVYNNIYSLIIGKKYTTADLGQWNRGKQFPELIVGNINGSISSVMFPVYSRLIDDKVALKSAVRRSMRLGSYFVFPMMVGLAVVAEPLVMVLLGEKWLPCVPFLQGWCFCYAFMPIHTCNLQVYMALGRSDIFLYLEIAKKVLGIVILIITLPFGLGWMMVGMMVNSIIASIINAVPNVFILKYSVFEQIKDILSALFISLVMGGVVYACKFIPVHYVVVLLIQVFVGVSIYVGLSALFRVESFRYTCNMLKEFMKKIKRKNNNISNSNPDNKDSNSSDELLTESNTSNDEINNTLTLEEKEENK